MAGTKISALTAAAALGGTEAIPGVQSAANVKITPAQIKTFTSASPTLVTPVLGVATGTSLALGGATIGTDLIGAGVSKFRVDSNGAVFSPTGALGGFNFGAGSAAIYNRAGNGVTLYSGGNVAEATNALFQLASTVVQGWASGTIGASSDTGLSRISAGVIGVGTGAQGSVAGGLQAATVIHAVGATAAPTMTFAGDLTTGFWSAGSGNISVSVSGTERYRFGSGGRFTATDGIDYGQNTSVPFAHLTSPATATAQFGSADAATPVAQTIKFQDVVAGTTNTAGVNATIQAPAGTGTGAGGSLIFQVAPAGSSGSAKNAQATALTIDSMKKVTLAGDLQLSNAYVATPQVPTGYITIYDSTGTAYKVSVNV